MLAFIGKVLRLQLLHLGECSCKRLNNPRCTCLCQLPCSVSRERLLHCSVYLGNLRVWSPLPQTERLEHEPVRLPVKLLQAALSTRPHAGCLFERKLQGPVLAVAEPKIGPSPVLQKQHHRPCQACLWPAHRQLMACIAPCHGYSDLLTIVGRRSFFCLLVVMAQMCKRDLLSARRCGLSVAASLCQPHLFLQRQPSASAD